MSLASKSFALLRQDVLLFVTNLATGVVIARTLGPANYGLWAILQLIPTYAEAFARPKVEVAGVYLLGTGRYGLAEMKSLLDRIALGAGLLVVAVVACLAGPLERALAGATGAGVLYAIGAVALQVPFQFLLLNYSKLLLLREDVRAYNRAVLLRTLSFAALSIGLLLGTGLGLVGVVAAGTASTALSCLYAAHAFGRVEPAAERTPGLLRDLVRHGAPLYAAGVVGHLHAYSTSTLVALYLSPANVGFLAMAQNLARLLERVTEALNMLLFPRITRMEPGVAPAQLTARAYRVMLVVMLLAGGAMALAVRPLVGLVYGREYLPAVLPFLVVLPGVIAYSASTVFMQYLVGIGRAGVMLRLSLAPLVLQVGLALLLIPRLGLLGGAVALSTASLLVGLLQALVFVRVAGPHARAADLLVRGEDLRTVAGFVRERAQGLLLQARAAFPTPSPRR